MAAGVNEPLPQPHTDLKARFPASLLRHLEGQHGLHVVALKLQLTDRGSPPLLDGGPHHELGGESWSLHL